MRSPIRGTRMATGFLLLLAGGALAVQAIPNLVGHWTLDELANPAADSSGNGNSGTWNGAPMASNQTPNPAVSANCIALDGVDDFANIGSPAVLSISSQITVSAWANLDAIGTERKILAKWGDTPGFDACWLLTAYTGNVNFWVQPAAGGQTAASAAMALTLGTWYHIAGTYDGANVRLYINGAPAASAALTGAIRTSAIPVRIGAGSGTTIAQEEPVDGRIDDVRIYDRALTATEIMSIYTTMTAPGGPPPVPPPALPPGANGDNDNGDKGFNDNCGCGVVPPTLPLTAPLALTALALLAGLSRLRSPKK